LAHALLCSLVRTSGVCASRNGNTPGVTDWQEQDEALVREFELPSFPAAIAFVDRLAELAESENHHPDIDIRYKRVTVRWTTHSEGGITEKDREMAERTSALAAA
jgi:4a-hydroxytetrahydrobiopterin dehydratase